MLKKYVGNNYVVDKIKKIRRLQSLFFLDFFLPKTFNTNVAQIE